MRKAKDKIEKMYEIAEKYGNRTSVKKLNPNTLKYVEYDLDCDLKEFGKFGVGL